MDLFSQRVGRYLLTWALVCGVACAPPEEQGKEVPLPIGSAGFRGMDELDQPLGELATPCAFDANTGVASIALIDGETANISKRVVDNALLVNGTACGTATTANLKQLTIDGSTGTEVVILDYLNGLFATGTSARVGVVVDLVSGANDELKLRGSNGADTFYFGTEGISLNADRYLDITFANVDVTTVSAGPGNDTVSGAGGYGAGGEYPAAMWVYGGAGNDTLTGGSAADTLYGDEGNDRLSGAGGDDTLYGGDGDDTFLEGNAPNGADTFHGEAGTDTVSYASRTGAVTATIAGGNVSGENAEADTVEATVEGLIGGSGDDLLTGDGNPNTLTGGSGDDTLAGMGGADTLHGGEGNDTLRGGEGDDLLYGHNGDDLFDEETSSNGADTFVGGAGTDTVSYAGRIDAGVTVSMNGVPGDGAPQENDNVRNDIENLIGTSFADNLTGNALNNVLTGGGGADVLYGLGGHDVFEEGASPNGGDTFIGGSGIDRINYSARTGNLTVTMGDGVANDGESGEGDNVGADVENLDLGTGTTNAVTGNALNNVIQGNSGADTLYGGEGHDTLFGAGGDDSLYGEGGDDLLDGGEGTNSLDGGPGSGDICYAGAATSCEL